MCAHCRIRTAAGRPRGHDEAPGPSRSQETRMKRPLAALFLVLAAVAALAVPAGASTRTTWTHQTLRCQGGRHATITYKMQGGAIVDSWADNGCRHQYLGITSCEVG